MIVARPRLRTSRERIKEHLVAGRQQSAVWLELMRVYGGQWRRWRHPETLKERMALTAVRFCRKWKLDEHWSQPENGAVRRAHKYVVEMILHLAHIQFGCPRSWRKLGNRRKLTMDEAQAKLEKRQRELARYTEIARQNTDLRLKHLAQWNQLEAKRLKARGASTAAIAKTLKVAESTVRSYLAAGRID